MKDLKNLKQEWIKQFNAPLVIAGPCSAETKEQVINTALNIDTDYVQIFRAGIWKPRTRPNDFEGIGIPGLKWLQDVKQQTGMLLATEVANAEHAKLALEYDIDILWIGARSTANPFTVQEIANTLENTNKIILVKNPINPDFDLWVGALERLAGKNIKKLGVIHRGFSTYKKSKYRNQPIWKIALDFKNKYPNIPIICDPSHICGNRTGILDICQQASYFGYHGFIIETHDQPDNAWTDGHQQIVPKKLIEIIKNIHSNHRLSTDSYEYTMNLIRTQIDENDEMLLSILSERMYLSQKVGKLKNDYKIGILQPNRWEKILQSSKNHGMTLGLSANFIEEIFKIIHQESINIQNNTYNKIS